MLIGVVSDTHDNLPATHRAAAFFAERGVDLILHAGDFVAPFALKTLLKPGIRVIGVFGNNDGERVGLGRLCQHLYEPPYRFELAGKQIVLAHAPSVLSDSICAGADLIIHGHTHEVKLEDGPPLTLNPGEAGGWLTGRCTIGLVNLDTMQAEIVDLPRQETVEL